MPRRRRSERLGAILAVVYLVFNEGYLATSAETLTRPISARKRSASAGCLQRMLPEEPEAGGLLALMLLQYAAVLPAWTKQVISSC